ncbi:hypothetical protein pb186bvf_019890 [Paramecium bursaria]
MRFKQNDEQLFLRQHQHLIQLSSLCIREYKNKIVTNLSIEHSIPSKWIKQQADAKGSEWDG